MLNVFHNHLIRYIAAATAKIATCPEMPTPVRFAKVRKLVQQLERRLTLEPLHQTTDRHLRRNRHKQVDMVAGHVTFDDVHTLTLAYLADHIPDPKGNTFNQHLLPILRYPHQMQVDRENRMRAMPVRHGLNRRQSTLKLPPERWGF